MNDSSLVFLGGAVKALGDGKVGGFLVAYGSEEQTDATPMKDFFTAKTDFDWYDGLKSTVYYVHTLDDALKGRKLSNQRFDLEMQDAGVWVEGQLALRDDYEKNIYGLAAKGKLGWSSGTASHLVERVAMDNGSHWIKRWPLGLDASLTPTPAEPRACAMSIKSYYAELLGVKDYGGATTSTYFGDYLPCAMTVAALSRLQDALWSAIYDLCDPSKTGIDRDSEVRKALDQFSDIAARTVSGIMSANGKSLPTDELAVLRTMATACKAVRAGAGLTLDEETADALKSVESVLGRLKEVATLRKGQGREPLNARRVMDVKALRLSLKELQKAVRPATADADRVTAARAGLALADAARFIG